jgi:hypothetical protein
MTEPKPPCERCGTPSERKHHATGRAHDGAYFDPQLFEHLCHDHHESEHDVLRPLALDEPNEPLHAVESLQWRLSRVAVTLKHLCDAWPGIPFLGRLAEALRSWAAILAAHIERLDLHCPAWRDLEPPIAKGLA